MTVTPLDAFKILPIHRAKHDVFEQTQRMRVNSLCSLWWFSKVILNRRDMNTSLHLPICKEMQKEHFKDVFEISRGHLKSTIGSEALPMWRVLDFSDADADYILSLKGEDGRALYDNAFCYFLTRVHNPNSTWITCSETEGLAKGLQARIQYHFESNQNFRSTFNSLLPHAVHRSGNRIKGPWGSQRLVINRPDRTIAEASFECRGAGQPLQSKHVTGGIIEDDLVGEKSLRSAMENAKRIDWHTRLAGVFYDEDPDHAGNQLIIGNRWSPMDLNAHIRAREPWFTIHSMGCLWCDHCKTATKIDLSSFKDFEKTGKLLCTKGHDTRPVFPEKFTLKKIWQEWRQMRAHGHEIDFTAQYLNDPGISSDGIFQTGWLQYYEFTYECCSQRTNPWDPPCSHKDQHYRAIPYAVMFQYEVTEMGEDGQTRLFAKWQTKRISEMNRYMILDPSYGADSIEACRNGLVVIGVDDENRKFLLEAWGRVCGLKEINAQVNIFSRKWDLDYVFVENAGGGRVVGNAINQANRLMNERLRAQPIVYKGEFRQYVQASDTPLTARKVGRIIASLEGVFESRQIWVREDLDDFLGEYRGFIIGKDGKLLPGTYVDILDALSYGPQLWHAPASIADLAMLEAHKQNYLMEVQQRGY